MKTFKIMLPTGSVITNKTAIKKAGNPFLIKTELGICELIKMDWCKSTKSKNFTDWAKSLNEDKNFEGGFTVEHALDNLCGMYQLNIDGEHVDLYNFFLKHKPFKQK
jgi:hypothetical protein